MSIEKDGTVNAASLHGLCVNCGVPGRLNLAGYDGESRLKELQSKSRALAEALEASAPVPLAIAVRYCDAQSQIASEALRLVTAYRDRLRNELDAVGPEVVRALTANLKGSETVKAMAAETVKIMVNDALGRQGTACYRHEARWQAVGVTWGALRGACERPRWLAEAWAARDSVDPVAVWRAGK